jgi:hypothetical protein
LVTLAQPAVTLSNVRAIRRFGLLGLGVVLLATSLIWSSVPADYTCVMWGNSLSCPEPVGLAIEGATIAAIGVAGVLLIGGWVGWNLHKRRQRIAATIEAPPSSE